MRISVTQEHIAQSPHLPNSHVTPVDRALRAAGVKAVVHEACIFVADANDPLKLEGFTSWHIARVPAEVRRALSRWKYDEGVEPFTFELEDA